MTADSVRCRCMNPEHHKHWPGHANDRPKAEVTDDAPWSHKYAEACANTKLPRLDRAKAEASADPLEAAYAMGVEAAANAMAPKKGSGYRGG